MIIIKFIMIFMETKTRIPDLIPPTKPRLGETVRQLVAGGISQPTAYRLARGEANVQLVTFLSACHILGIDPREALPVESAK
jgi:hypothetical protein